MQNHLQDSTSCREVWGASAKQGLQWCTRICRRCVELAVQYLWNIKAFLIRQEEGNQTNFQRASLTLAAGVVIYSQRVDSIHNDAFKVLTGLSRSAARGVHEDEGTNPSEADIEKGCKLGKGRKGNPPLPPPSLSDSYMSHLSLSLSLSLSVCLSSSLFLSLCLCVSLPGGGTRIFISFLRHLKGGHKYREAGRG
jgi:hypothetical protein